MNLMLCMNGEPEELLFLPQIAELGAGIELGSYGLSGIRSPQHWEKRRELHRAVRERFDGSLAIHGPFLGMEYTHPDHLIREVVMRRLDMTFEAAVSLKAIRVILHTGCTPEIALFRLEGGWLKESIAFWSREIPRWANAGIEIVLENDTDPSPDLAVALVTAVNHPALCLCLDTGHQNVFSSLGPVEWVRRMGIRLNHIHLHDNDGIEDRHWSPGRGTMVFEPFYAALEQSVPNATISLEAVDTMDTLLGDLRSLAARFPNH